MKDLNERVPIDTAKLRALREKRKLLPTEMASAMRVVENTYRAIENGERDPKLSQVLAMMKALKLGMNELSKICLDELQF